jgi:hypothetical protein
LRYVNLEQNSSSLQVQKDGWVIGFDEFRFGKSKET